MDWALIIQAAPQYAVVAFLIILISRVTGHATVDRSDYRADLDAAEQRHAGEIARMREQHAADLDALRAELAEMRARLAELTTQLDAERRARWAAEDVAAEARRLAAAAEANTTADGV